MNGNNRRLQGSSSSIGDRDKPHHNSRSSLSIARFSLEETYEVHDSCTTHNDDSAFIGNGS